MKKHILIIIILTLSISTFAQTRADRYNIVGTWKYYFGFFEYTLVVNPDSTYKFNIAGDLNNNKTEGTWKLHKNKLVLNSYKQKPDESRVVSHYIDSIIGIRLSIRDIFGEPVVMPEIKLIYEDRSIDTLMTNYNGLFEFPGIENIRSLEVSFIGLKNVSWNENLKQNFFEFIMAPEYQDYIYQTNEKWKIKKDRLYHPHYKKDKRVLNNNTRVNYFTKIKN